MLPFLEIAEFSLLFIFPAVVVMLIALGACTCYCVFRKKKICFVIHWIDVLIPFVSTALWCRFQSYSPFVKSLGNLAEISITGLAWGGMFLVRNILAIRENEIPIWKYVAVECAITIALALFAPTFSE